MGRRTYSAISLHLLNYFPKLFEYLRLSLSIAMNVWRADDNYFKYLEYFGADTNQCNSTCSQVGYTPLELNTKLQILACIDFVWNWEIMYIIISFQSFSFFLRFLPATRTHIDNKFLDYTSMQMDSRTELQSAVCNFSVLIQMSEFGIW